MKETIIITGANNGIGFSMTRTLLADGFYLAALDIKQNNLDKLLAEFPDRLLVYDCDISDAARVTEIVNQVAVTWGQIDILVNNACIAIFKSFEAKTVAETRREFDVNFFGMVHTIQAVLPHMKEKGRGIIHNVSSGVGITGFPGIHGYASTKGAIESLTRTLALEFENSGIHINLMHPPLTDTRSAAPLGLPAQVMENAEKIGSALAKKIRSTKPLIAADFRTAIYLFFAYRYPLALGTLFARLTEKANSNRMSGEL